MQNYAKRLGVGALAFGCALVVGLSAPTLVNAGSQTDVIDRLDLLEQQTIDLSRSLQQLNFAGEALVPPAIVTDGPIVAQVRDIAAINVRLDTIEAQLRSLTGQVEGVQFQMTQIYQQLERMQEDNDFRFGELETALGKTDAVTQADGVTPVGELPQTQSLQTESQSVAATETGGSPLVSQDPSLPDASILDMGAPMDDTGIEDLLAADGAAVGDPSVSFDQPLTLDLATEGDRIDFGASTISGEGTALALDFDPGQLVSDGDADAQYQAGFDAVLGGDYDFAIAQFSQFVSLFPDHALAPDANNWLGESLLQKGEYADAAEVFFVGFQRYENSTRAPDLLLKLGVALYGAGERETACRTFVEVQRRFPNMGGAFDQRIAEEMATAQC